MGLFCRRPCTPLPIRPRPGLLETPATAGDPDSDVGRLEDDTPLRRAQNTADRIKQQQQQDLGEGGGGGGGGSLEGGERDVRAADQDTAGGGGGGGLLAAVGPCVSQA